MASINTIDYSRFGNENFLAYCREFSYFLGQFEIIGQRFGYLVTPYLAAVEQLDEAMRQPTWSEKSEPIKKKDEERDKVLIAFKALVESMRHYSPVEGVMAAAEKVHRFIKLNHSNPAAQYDRETSQISNLLQDLERYCHAEIELMGVQQMLVQLGTLNDEMADLLAERDIDDSQKRSEAVRIARRQCDTLYVALKDTINAAALVDSTSELSPFIAAVNQMIKRNESQVLKTPTTGGNQTDGNQTGGNQTEEEEEQEEEEEEETERTLTWEYPDGHTEVHRYKPGQLSFPEKG